ncbi:hypothetical protein C0J52_10866 [Blattella germanica]|nr:hypothetical protein C0J52_10866 [Blattella germanica]
MPLIPKLDERQAWWVNKIQDFIDDVYHPGCSVLRDGPGSSNGCVNKRYVTTKNEVHDFPVPKGGGPTQTNQGSFKNEI